MRIQCLDIQNSAGKLLVSDTRECTRYQDEVIWQPVPRSAPTTLGYFVADYVAHLEHHLAQLRRTVAAIGAAASR